MAERKSKKTASVIGLGVVPEEGRHGFVLRLGNKTHEVFIFEYRDTAFDDDGALRISDVSPADEALRVILTRAKWDQISRAFWEEASRRLKRRGLPTIKQPSKGDTPMHASLGKELCVLCWAIEEAEDDVIPAAIVNWEGLAPEERWWLYTMTAAATGQATQSGRGWRKALRFALTDNPVGRKGEGLSPKARKELAESLRSSYQMSLL